MLCRDDTYEVSLSNYNRFAYESRLLVAHSRAFIEPDSSEPI